MERALGVGCRGYEAGSSTQGCSPSTRASTRSVMGALSDSEASPLVHSEFRRHSLSSRDKFKRKGDATASERIKLADSK
ncbi:hypothetical protein PHYSODRAFT_328976 [Phytophthora sojae]|uniref:Uncharacterized protein n=1 Tax=Phytophthora sojae (strain P6497) TaxID=1094619 RepID=G4Z5E3_PHYSP|nr:hypothetical protein PHYSODRAFT_328976 [Phytophthora sojae]EGZ20928.1 hypothetical protein PHYSODRAFT_328976 [Phytophthora sojae]|eukprot:XP_009523645.1 hypothetical protein PHYSODRAFT_328976 [Phytophthora sojae]